MNPNKNLIIVNAGETRILVASLNYQKLQSQDMVTWKKKVYSKDEVKANPYRLLFAIEDTGDIHYFGKELSTNYKFTRSDVGKYIKFYSYVEGFNALAQCVVFYVEEKHNTNIRITGVERIDSESKEIYVGQKLNFKVDFSVTENKVSYQTRESVKWMVKMGDSEERLIINGTVITGSDIEFVVPEYWIERGIMLMPYLNNPSTDVSISLETIGYALGIKTLTPLDKGSRNDSSNSTRDGMIYGKTYELEVQFLLDLSPIPNDGDIHWEYSFSDEDSSQLFSKTCTGRKLTIKIDDLNMLGQEMDITVYIGKNREDGYLIGNIKQWVHYRFRFFDRQKVVDQLKDRKEAPWKIDQGQTPLCGMAAIFYLFAKYQPIEYMKTIADLHRVGKATFNGYTIEPYKGMKINNSPSAPRSPLTIDVSDIMCNMNPKEKDYPEMPEADWLALAVTRSKESTETGITPLIYEGKKGDGLKQILGVNWPDMLESVCKKLLRYKNVRQVDLSNTSIVSVKFPKVRKEKPLDSVKKLIKIDELYKMGHDIMMMIDSNMLSGETSYEISDIFTRLHWIVYEGNLKMFDVNEKPTRSIEKVQYVKFDIYTWGVSIKNSQISQISPGLSLESFHSTYFGHIDCWNN